MPPQDVGSIRSGELTDGWSLLFAIGWGLTAAAFAAVWRASWQLGLPTWWLTDPGSARGAVLAMVPFVPPALLVAAAARRVRWLPWWGVVGGACLAVVGALDLGDVPGLAAAQIAAAGAGVLVSLASLGGMYRSAPPGR